MAISVLIVDDEELARNKLKKFLHDETDFEMVGESGDGCDAVQQIIGKRPQVVFLDVQMPEMDGFGVLRCLPNDSMPCVIFVTAHDQFAVRAFEVHALDYLLKPFDHERFKTCLERLRRHFLNPDPNADRSPLHSFKSALSEKQQVDRIPVRFRDKIVLINPLDVDWVEAADNYVVLHQGKQDYIFRSTMSSIENRLRSCPFLRVSRSALINTEKIAELQPLFRGEYVIVLKNGDRVQSSRTYKETLRQLIAP